MKGNSCPTCGHEVDEMEVEAESPIEEKAEVPSKHATLDMILAELQELGNKSMGDPLQAIVEAKSKKPEVI